MRTRFPVHVPCTTILFLLILDATLAADFPQWRGVDRTGVVKDSPPLADSWGPEGPPRAWESEVFPRRSGHGSPVIAGGHVFVYLNWPFDRELTERTVSGNVLNKIRWFDQEKMPESLVVGMEKARAGMSPELRGRELREWVEAWLEKNLSEDDRRWRGTVSQRLMDGPDALPLEVLAKLGSVRDRPFATEEALETWLRENGIEGKIRDRVVGAIPTKETFARDVLLCVSLKDGKTAWTYTADGRLQDRDGSSTPCVHENRVYFLGTTNAHCVDRQSGERIWATELPKGGCPSSFVIERDQAIVVAKHLMALGAETGSILWEQSEVRGGDSSPTIWKHGEKTYVLVNGDGRRLSCVDAETGAVAWTVKGGGVSSPVVSGDIAILHTDDERLGLVAYGLSPTAAEPIWNVPRESRGAATPIVTRDTVYVLGGDEALCIALRDGSVQWRERARVEISSPLLVDGKIVSIAGSGRQLWVLGADRKEFKELSKTRLSAARCTSPAMANGLLILRSEDRVVGLDLRR